MRNLRLPSQFHPGTCPIQVRCRHVSSRSVRMGLCGHIPYAQRGFTLIETLATLTIFAIVMALLSSSLFQVARLAELSENQTTQSRDTVIRLSWLKNSLNAGVTDWVGGNHLFQGGARHVSGLTTRPLSSQFAGRTAFEWRLIYNAATATTELRYREASLDAAAWSSASGMDGDILIHAWSGNIGRFSFLQDTGEFSDNWSARIDPVTRAPILPVGVLLEFGEVAESTFVTIADRSPPITRLRDI